MKLPFYKQFIIIVLLFSIAFNADLSRFVQAADNIDTAGTSAENLDPTDPADSASQYGNEEFDNTIYDEQDVAESFDNPTDPPPTPATIASFQALADATKEISQDSDAIFNLSTALGMDNSGVSRITMPVSDLAKIKNIYYMAKVLPDYENDFTSLYRDLPAPSKVEVDKALTAEAAKTTPLFNSPEMYFAYLKDGGDNVTAAEMTANIAIFDKLVLSAEERLDSEKIRQIWNQIATDIQTGKEITADTSIIAKITGMTVADIETRLQRGTADDRKMIATKITDFLTTSLIDIRIVKTLVYLVTPKSQGGAGHWKITVSRIFQKSTTSNESQPETTTLTSDTTNSATNCPTTATAADCGQLQNSRATAEVEDQNGQQYEAYLQDLTAQEDQTTSNTATVATADETKKPTTVHASGQAVDISEIDDIRCTLIQKKRIGADKISAQPIQPIKLAWQTNEGYAASGGNGGDDVMGMMRTVAGDALKEFLSTFNGDLNYDGDLSRASFDDILKILGESMVGYAVSGNGQMNLKGYDTKSTLKNLGGMYLADYMGLPREIFTGDNALLNGKNDIEDVKYLIGRTAIEQRLGLPYGSLDNAITVNGEVKHNLEGLLTNLGRRKLEYEMNLEQGALKNVNTTLPIDFAVGKSIIEQEFNLKTDTWPTKGMTFTELKGSLPVLRIQTMKQDPGYVDGLFHVASGTTQALIDGKITAGGVTSSFNAYDYAMKIGRTRMDDSATGLKYFATYNQAYQLPEGTWEKAIAADNSAFKTIGIYTLARLLGDDSLAPETKGKIPDGVTAASVTWTEDGLPYTYNAEQSLGATDLGKLGFRTWLRENLNPAKTKDNACKTNHTGFNVNVAVNNNAGRTLSESMDLIRTQVCPLDVVIPYSISYKEPSSLSLLPTSVDAQMIVDIPETKAKAVGLDSLDLYRIMGYADADGTSVFTRIGSKILYYGLTNKALSGDDRMKIDLKDVNPVITTDNREINFYIDHIFTAIDLANTIKTDWEIIKKDSTQAKAIADKIDDIVARLGTTFSDGETDASKFQKIAAIAKDVSTLVSDLIPKVNELKEYYKTLSSTDAQQKVQQINGMLIHVNALTKCIAEIVAGKEVKQVDDLQLNQIELTVTAKTNLTDNSSDRRTNKKISPWKMASLLFGFLSGKTNLTDTFISIGSGVAEANLGLPANSLYYLVQNYEERGLQTVDGFYEAIGQARIEEQFNMPAFYFQGFSLDSKMPKFSTNHKLLEQWLPTSTNSRSGVTRDYTALKKLSDNDFEKFLTQLLFPKLVLNMYGGMSAAPIVNSPLANANYSTMIADAEENWQATRTAELAKNGRSTIGEKTTDDVVRNLTERGYGDGIRTAKDDLLFKMGLPTGIYDSLTSGGSSGWSKYSATATNIDSVFDIPTGSTQSLFTGEAGLYTTSITNKEKNQVEASPLNIGQNFLEKYIQLLNGEILPSEMEMYAYGQTADYINNNPYAKTPDTADTCPIIFTDAGSFKVNNSTQFLTNDSFCFYDQKGRHCFQSADEAQRYANENDADSLKHMRLEDTNHDGVINDSDEEIGNDILGYMAMKLTIAYNAALLTPGAGNDAFGRPATDPSGNSLGESLKLHYIDIYDGLTKFVNDKSAVTIFDGITINGIKMNSGVAFALISQQTDLSTDLLTRLFSRVTLDAPVANYKRLVGREEAQKIITATIFNFSKNNQLGIGPFAANLFDSGDFYDILHGDFSSISRIGAKIVDDQMELKPGTTALIAAAGSQGALTCAMAQAGGQYFGKLFGLSYLPLNGISGTKDFIVTVGETKIEEELTLPLGSFRGATISNVIDSMGAINFAVAFKLPQKTAITYADIVPILGANKASPLTNASDLDKLKAVQRFLTGAPVVSNVAYDAMRQLEAKIKENNSYIIDKLSSANPADLQNSIGPNSDKTEVSWHNDVATFVYLLWDLDARFEIPGSSTFKLFSKQITPDAYVRLVADKAILRAGAVGFGHALGLDSTQSDAAANILLNFQVIFFCSSPNDDTHGKSHSLKSDGTCDIRNEIDSGFGYTNVTHNNEPMYHNWSYVYANLDKVFNFRLDEQANVPQGTMAQLIREPQNAFKLAMKIGTGKLDQKYDFDPNAISSFSGLFKYLFPSEAIVTPAVPDDNSADILLTQGHVDINDAINKKLVELSTYQSPYNTKFGELIPIVEAIPLDKTKENEYLLGTENILMSSDSDENKLNSYGNLASQYITNTDTYGKLFDIFETLIPLGIPVSRCLSELNTLESQRAEIENQIAARNSERANAIVTARSARAAEIDKDNASIPATYKLLHRVWAWAIDAAAEQLHKKILNVEWNGENIGIDMPINDIKMIFTDLRYVAVAGMAMSANLVQIQVDRIGSNNCNSTQSADGKCPTAVPANFRITYADFYAAFFGLPSLDANRLSAYIYVTGNTADPSTTPFNFSNIACPDSGTGSFSTGIDCLSTVTPGYQNTTVSITVNTEKNYGFTTENYTNEIANQQSIISTTQSEAEDYCLTKSSKEDPGYQNCYDEYVNADPKYQEAINNVDVLNHPENHQDEIKNTKNGVQAQAKTNGWENLQFKLMDIGLWKLDDNTFPGFSRSLMRGNTETKIAALTKYFENGLYHGHLFGIKFDALGANGVLVADFVAQFIDHKFVNKDPAKLKSALVGFAAGVGLNFMTDWVVKNSKAWFGFKMPPDVFKGIIVGLCTGEWGFTGISVDQVTGTSTAKTTDIGGGIKLPTLGSALVNFATNWVFNWADKQYKWKPGTAFTVFMKGYELYKDIKTINNLRKISDIADLDNAKIMTKGVVDSLGGTEAVNKLKATNDSAKVKDASKVASAGTYASIYKIILYFVSPAVGRTVHARYDEDFRKFENDNGLVPGSLNILVDSMVDLVCTVALTAIVWLLTSASILGPAALAGALIVLAAALTALMWAAILFVITNLFGVYEVDYYCDADGYYPYIDSSATTHNSGIFGINHQYNQTAPPNYITKDNDISGLGVWGGKVSGQQKSMQALLQSKSIAAAQYKAKTLIGDLLTLQNFTKYNDSSDEPTVPIQIMTGRQIDVTNWESTISTNMCAKRLGEGYVSQNGICSSTNSQGIVTNTTRMGVWFNIQNVAFTHIGF